ncbi:hypothetical protein B0A54_16829 [Friedmanniomyces endolithicus]|uniref:ATP synthase subunit J, mitochondrial n=1 Tax=Friedmanniomyces endolithicus TaxID=329885 RepID=A0A4U0TVP3_9PEZI|nr:hypothetical protein B0A54_16829 [Friedmanniomyces endolithicus]
MEAPRSSLLGKKYPVPILRTMWPFYTAGKRFYTRDPRTLSTPAPGSERLDGPRLTEGASGLIVAYGINSFATTLANSDEYRNDPRNPALKSGAKAPEKH